jgi:hypothetical protein
VKYTSVSMGGTDIQVCQTVSAYSIKCNSPSFNVVGTLILSLSLANQQFIPSSKTIILVSRSSLFSNQILKQVLILFLFPHPW